MPQQIFPCSTDLKFLCAESITRQISPDWYLMSDKLALTRKSQVYMLLADCTRNKQRANTSTEIFFKKKSHHQEHRNSLPDSSAHIFRSVVHVPWTLGRFVTCLVRSFTTFLPREFLNLVACNSISSGGKFLTQTTRSLWFSAQWQR